MAKARHHFLIFLHLYFLHKALSQQTNQNPDANSLLSFKQTSDTTSSLSSWSNTTTLCTSWYGVTCSTQGRVTKLVLESLSLHGPFPVPLLSLSSLRVLSLSHNFLTGPLPKNISSLSSLKLLFLSHNSFSGQIPLTISTLTHLYRLDLSYNNFSGPISPLAVNTLVNLLTLRVEHNDLSGEVSEIRLRSIQEFNVSWNGLVGEIPVEMSQFPVSAFVGNRALCGPPLQAVCNRSAATDPAKPGGGDTTESPPPGGGGTSVVVSSSPSSVPDKMGQDGNARTRDKFVGSGVARMSIWAITAIILGDILVLALISLLLYCYFWRKKKNNSNNGEGTSKSSVISNTEKIMYSTSSVGGNGFERPGRMVFFEGARRFELEDLLRASAEMLGKGVFGTAYKAVLDDGSVVAVKRLKEANVGGGKKEFEQLMEVLGRLRHTNLVGLKAYYFARDEKLLVFDYLPNGSLFWLLHGNRGPGRTPLDWTTRLKIAAGAARGVAFIHNSCKALKLVHGNIKSTNILIDKAGNACVSDFGLSSFAPTSSANNRSNGYCAPETLDGRRLTQKADVYSFGVLLLELLTGKYPSVVDGNSGPYGTVGVGGVVDLPRWVQSVVREEWTAEVFDLELMRYKDIEEEMVSLLQIAMACTSVAPDQRPRMCQVIKMIEEIRGVEVSPLHEVFDSDSPSVSEDTTGGVSQ